VTLTCTSCHDPHGNGSYRILRPVPNGSGAAADVVVADETTKTYTVASADNGYFGQRYASPNTLDRWCAQCHTRHEEYRAVWQENPPPAANGDAIFTYRHMTRAGNWDTTQCGFCHTGGGHGGGSAENPFGISGTWIAHLPVCSACHVAHGSSALMGTYSGAVPWPGGAPGPSGDGRSSLLRLDNRGTCYGCHANKG